MSLRVNLLGDLQVLRDGEMVTPSPSKLRRLLALLTLEAGSTVHNDRIRRELWGSAQPGNAATILQTYISTLRRLLIADAGHTELRHVRGVGYQLALARVQVDAHRFMELTAQGNAEVRANQHATAVETFRSAMACWRGPALADVDSGDMLAEHVSRLEQVRRDALDQWMASEVALGKPAVVVATLPALIKEFPLHEGMHETLMRALHSVGRRGDALELYREFRERAADELGLDPGARLRRLHESLLNDELPGTYGDCGAPAQLPPDVPALHGRDAQLTAARNYIVRAPDDAPKVVAVVGAPGIGKSAFCAHLAHRIADRFPHGHLHADLAQSDTAAVLANFLTAIGETSLPASTEHRRQLYHAWSQRRRVLVSLDNVTDATPLEILLPAGGGSAAILGCRSRLSEPRIGLPIELKSLTEHDMAAMLDAARARREPDQIRALVTTLGGLPQLLAAVAGLAARRPHWSLARIANRLQAENAVQMEFPHAWRRLVASIDLTLRALPSPCRQTLARVCECAGDRLTTSAVAQVAGCDVLVAESVLETLVEYRLADIVEPTVRGGFGYRLMPFVRAALASGALASAANTASASCSCVTVASESLRSAS